MPANSELVIVRAPVRTFTAGIGEAVVTKFEVAQAVGAGGPNMLGASGSPQHRGRASRRT